MIGERFEHPIGRLGELREQPGSIEVSQGQAMRRVEVYDGPRLIEARLNPVGRLTASPARPAELLGGTREAFADAWLEVRHWIEPWARRRVLRAGLVQWRERARPRWRATTVADEQPIVLWMAFAAWRMGAWRWEEPIENFENELARGRGGPALADSL